MAIMRIVTTLPPLHVTPSQVVAVHGKLVDQVESVPVLGDTYLEGEVGVGVVLRGGR